MAVITLETSIKAGIEICFDLSRSIDLHQVSTAHTNEKAIDGITTGLINLGEYVTWQATHFGIRQELSSKITAFDRPFHFRDEQVKWPCKYIIHDHSFEVQGGYVVMKDIFSFLSPFGIIGRIFDKIVLAGYLKKLLTTRNDVIKEYAETGKWKSVL